MNKSVTQNRRESKTLTSTATALAVKVGPNLFSIFPEELWLMIFNCIQNHATFQNLINAVEDFLTVFKEQFPCIKFTQVSPLTFEYQPALNIETSRLLDKNWCESVSNFLQQNHPVNSSHFSVGKPVKKEIVPELMFNYLLSPNRMDLQAPQICSTVEDINQLCLKLKGNENIGILPPIKLCKKAFADPRLYFAACIALFTEYGNLLHSVSMDVHTHLADERITVIAFFQEIANCLQYLPKVRTLSISVTFVNCYYEYIDSMIDTIKFPLMPCLENLEICSPAWPTSESSCIQTYLLDCCRKSGYFQTGQIKKLTLQIIERDWKFQEKFRCFLKHKLESADTTQDKHEFVRFLDRQEKSSVFVKLRSSSLSELFNWLNERHLTTEELHVDVSGFRSSSENILPLPQIRYLKILSSSMTGFQFLTALPFLQYLHVQCHQTFSKPRAAKESPLSRLVLKYLYVVRVPKECNIWNELPTLKILIVEDLSSAGKPSLKHFVREYGNKPIVFTS